MVENRVKQVGYSARAMVLYACCPTSDVPDAFRHANTCTNNYPTRETTHGRVGRARFGSALGTEFKSRYLLFRDLQK